MVAPEEKFSYKYSYFRTGSQWASREVGSKGVRESSENGGNSIKVLEGRTYHGWHLARYDRLAGRDAHLLHQCILEGQMIASVYQ